MLFDCSKNRIRRGPTTRREMLVRFGDAGLGLSLPMLLAPQAVAGAAESRKRSGSADRSLILLFLSGGPSQYETFDPKPDAPSEIRGTFQPIETNVSGIRISETMPLLARQAHRYALLRSVTHTESNHPAGVYWMITGRKYPRATGLSVALSRQDHPHIGSVVSALRPPTSRSVPGFVTLPEQMNPNGPIRSGQHAGFLGAAADPMVINGDPNSPAFTPGELRIRDGYTEGRILRRRVLLEQANIRARMEEEGGSIGLQPHFSQAFDLITGGRAAQAFDLSREPSAMRDRYGRHIFGQGTLMARRLVEAGVRTVAVNWVRHDDGAGGQGWDSHADHLPWSKNELNPPTDRALAALLSDLDDRGMLETTTVVLMGEFGRTPRFNKDGGRDHWPHVFSVLMAGGGIRGGQVYGSSTVDGAYPASDPVSPADVTATIAHCLGIDPEEEYHDPVDRPWKVSEGQVIRGIL